MAWTEAQLQEMGLLPPHEEPLEGILLRLAQLSSTALNVTGGAWVNGPGLGTIGARAGTAVAGGGTLGATALEAGAVATTAGAVGVGVGAAAGPILAFFAGMYALGQAHELGENQGQRNAWRRGFAQACAAFARGQNYHAGGPNIDQAIRGRNAVVRLCNPMDAETRRTFLSRYAGSGGFRTALRDLGGYEVGHSRVWN